MFRLVKKKKVCPCFYPKFHKSCLTHSRIPHVSNKRWRLSWPLALVRVITKVLHILSDRFFVSQVVSIQNFCNKIFWLPWDIHSVLLKCSRNFPSKMEQDSGGRGKGLLSLRPIWILSQQNNNKIINEQVFSEFAPLHFGMVWFGLVLVLVVVGLFVCLFAYFWCLMKMANKPSLDPGQPYWFHRE